MLASGATFHGNVVHKVPVVAQCRTAGQWMMRSRVELQQVQKDFIVIREGA